MEALGSFTLLFTINRCCLIWMLMELKEGDSWLAPSSQSWDPHPSVASGSGSNAEGGHGVPTPPPTWNRTGLGVFRKILHLLDSTGNF